MPNDFEDPVECYAARSSCPYGPLQNDPPHVADLSGSFTSTFILLIQFDSLKRSNKKLSAAVPVGFDKFIVGGVIAIPS